MQKNMILKNAKKIGFIYLEDNVVTKSWKKYVAILSDNYIYIFKDKNDINYVYYYYIRNSEINILDNADTNVKYFIFRLKNKINTVNFAFEKQNILQSWIDMINKHRDQDDDTISTVSDISTVSKKDSTKGDEKK